MDARTREFVRQRAGECCEYCKLPQAGHEERFSVDHVIPSKHVRDDRASNLAFTCLRCNLYKGTNLSGIDPETQQIVQLFNPRRDTWNNHFAWSGPVIMPQTPESRATVAVMEMNAPERVRLRQALMNERLMSAD